MLKISTPAANPDAVPVSESIPPPAAERAAPIETGPASTFASITTGVTTRVRIIRIACSESTATTLTNPPNAE